MFEGIFKNNRTTEPISVFVFRLVVKLLLSIILVLYTVLLILEIYNDQPVTVDSVVETNSLPVPGECLCFLTFQRILILIVISHSGISEYNKECMKYITQPIVSISSEYVGSFQAAENVTFSTNSNQGLSAFRIMIYGDFISNSAMNISVIDPGLVPDLVNLPYITSTQESVPITNSSTIQTSLIELNFKPQSFIIQVLNSLGLLGGAWGLTISLLVLLFGNNILNPWGFVQRHNKTMQENLMTFSELIPNNSDNEMSIQELKQKLNLLQLLLGDYLVNAEYLKKIQQLEMKSSNECNS
ncbi:12438_t:CDS:2 [Dentiscutata erythropus]|uniref:12438_t:CDS:1 n=1 Tax=Dentiscutata erythropus TaxID=1348616 RepID=A0A9N8ZIS0_9GLOM|nr:12438_t:CDS:2 [Dentiscutata erythropus]